MKNRFLVWVMLFFMLLMPNLKTEAAFSEGASSAIRSIMDDVEKSLVSNPMLKGRTVSIMSPIKGDSAGYVEGMLKNAITKAGMSYVEVRTNTLWSKALEEIEAHERKIDIIDNSALIKLGKLKLTQRLFNGSVRVANGRANVYAELELHLNDLETNSHIWGDVFSKRYYAPSDIEGIIELNENVRALLKDAFSKGYESLKKSRKLKGIKSIAIVPLSGDIDEYATGLAYDMVTKTDMNPKNLDIVSLSEARYLLRSNPEKAQAILYGAVRDLSRKIDKKEFGRNVYKINAEVQLRIQATENDNVLWSETISVSGSDIDEKAGVMDRLWVSSVKSPETVSIVMGILIGVVIIIFLIRAMTRPR